MRSTTVAAVLACLLLAGCGSETLMEVAVLRPVRALDKTPLDYGYDYQEYSVPVADGRSVVAWHVPSTESKALAVVVPGSMDSKSWWLKAAPVIIPHGYDALFMDFEGYGNSPGTPSFQHTIDDTLAVVRFAQTLHPKVILYGGSMGAPLAVRAAAEYQVAAVILEGSLVFEVEPRLWLAQYHLDLPPLVGFLETLVRAQVPEGFDIIKYVSLVDAPKFIIHSVHDDIVPFPAGQMVYDAAAEPKTFWQIDGGHGRLIDYDPQAYGQAIAAWVDTTLAEQAGDAGQ